MPQITTTLDCSVTLRQSSVQSPKKLASCVALHGYLNQETLPQQCLTGRFKLRVMYSSISKRI
jgi:hypothetical protein